MSREQQELVADYIARGGTVRRLPTPEPTDVQEVIDYMQDCRFDVYPAPRGAGQRKYVLQGEVVTLARLVLIANEHRAKRRLPPFQLVQPLH